MHNKLEIAYNRIYYPIYCLSKLKCNGVSTTVVASLLGHTEEVNEQYYTYDITEMQDKRVMVGMVTKDIVNAQIKKEANTVLIDQKVIEGNQNYCLPQFSQAL